MKYTWLKKILAGTLAITLLLPAAVQVNADVTSTEEAVEEITADSPEIESSEELPEEQEGEPVESPQENHVPDPVPVTDSVTEQEEPKVEMPENASVQSRETRKNGWVLQNGTYYYYENGNMVTGWKKVDGYWYYMDQSGVMVTGWLQLGKTWYYLNQYGAMVTGWREVNHNWYYFQSSGAMTTGWVETGDTYYYFKDWGGMAVGWYQYNNNWYYFDKNGLMLKGWQKIGNTQYYFKDWGGMTIGWRTIDGTYYYFDKNGAMQRNKWIGTYYYVTSDGSMATDTWIGDYYVDSTGRWIPGYSKDQEGWVQTGEGWKYKKSDGSYATGWLTVSDKKYYFNSSGIMQKGWLYLNGSWYYLLTDSTQKAYMAVSQWIDGSGRPVDSGDKGYYYIDKYGKMVAGETYSLGNYIYSFDESGKCTGWEERYVTAVDPANGKKYTLEKQYATDPQVGKDITERDLLAAVTYREAGNQGVEGMTAVAMVILNRMESSQFPDTLSYVIYQKGQFEVARNHTLTTMLESIRDKTETYELLKKYKVYEAVDDAYASLEAYRKNGTPRTIEGITLPDNKKDFDYLFFMTPAAFAASGLDPVKSESMTYKGHTFFVKYIYS